jgi:hypothetical protein
MQVRSGGELHAEACSIIAFDHSNFGSLSSMRRADGYQIG